MLHLMRAKNKRIKTIWWILIVATVVTFVGGFVFLLGAGFDSSYRARASGAIGTVDGKNISRVEYQNALQQQRELYQRKYGQQPTDRDQKAVEQQTWRSLVVQKLLDREAKKLGLKAYDPEVVLAMQTSPPAILASAPAFQTDGKFDPNKYRAALNDPNNNWSAFEDMARDQIPIRKLQQRLVSSLKISEPELYSAFRYQFERVRATVVVVPPDTSSPAPVPDDAAIQQAYETYGSLYAAPERARVEVALAPKQYTDDEVKAARDLAQSLVNRARNGEDFAALARDYSEGAAADSGGVIKRVFSPNEFGQISAQAAVAAPGTILGPVQDRSRFMVFKVLDRPVQQDGSHGLRVAQIVTKVRPNVEELDQQRAEVSKVRKQATKVGLGRAAATRGIPTMDTGFFTMENPSQALAPVPEAVDWALSAKEGEVSPVFEGTDDFAVVQVTARRPAGVPKRDEITDQLTQFAVLNMRLDRSKPIAEKIAKEAEGGGESLEQAAHAAGLQARKSQPMARISSNPEFGDAAEMLGALFAAKDGQVVGPFRSTAGWYVARRDQFFPADSTFFEQVKSQLSSDLLQRRQQTFLSNYVESLREKAKIQDLRYDPNQ